MISTEKHNAPEVSRSSMVVAALSTVVEWYDFTLYLYFATVLSRVFFGGGHNSLLATLAGFAISYGMRPLGAMVFGHIGDRYGRARALLISVAMMAIPTVLMGLLPTYASIGVAASFLIVVLRMFQGMAVGGEFTSSIVFLMHGVGS